MLKKYKYLQMTIIYSKYKAENKPFVTLEHLRFKSLGYIYSNSQYIGQNYECFFYAKNH